MLNLGLNNFVILKFIMRIEFQSVVSKSTIIGGVIYVPREKRKELNRYYKKTIRIIVENVDNDYKNLLNKRVVE